VWDIQEVVDGGDRRKQKDFGIYKEIQKERGGKAAAGEEGVE